MSRGYRIAVPSFQSSATVVGSDATRIEIGLLPILGQPEMRELLRDGLVAAGWTRTADGASHEQDGVVAELSADGGSVTVSATARHEVQASAETRAEADRRVAGHVAAGRAGATREATRKIARVEADVRATLEEVIQRVYVTALERKARSLGEVQSIRHGTTADGGTEVVIKVRV